MAIARNISRLLEDSEPLYKPTSRTTVAPAPKPAPAPAPVSSSFLSSLAAKYQAPATTAAIQAAIAPPPPPVVAPPAPANPFLVSDTQYRGAPIQQLPPAPNYAAPAPVASTPANPFKLSPEALASIAALSAQYNKAAAPVNPLTPAPVPATTAAIQAAIAPPAGAMPSIQDYLAQKTAAFNPVTLREPDDGGSEGVSSPGLYSSYDPAADIAEYKRLYGAQANPWDIAVAETPGKESGSIMSPEGRTYTPYTVSELQDQFLSEQTKLTPEGFNKLNVKTRPAKDYDTYLANYDKKFQALPENMKQRAGLQGELLNQAGAYGFKWDTTDVPAGHHTYNIAKILEKSNVKSVGDLEWRTVNGEDKLFNKATGAPVEMFKGRQKQLGWASQGPGLVNYMVEKDGQGNPVIVPQWKSNAPGGVAGTLLKIAPIALSFVNPALGAAAAGISSVIQGGDIVDALKSAGTSYLGGKLGAGAAELAGGAKTVLGGAAQGATQSAVRGIATGDLNLKDVATGAFTGGATSGITSLLTPDQITDASGKLVNAPPTAVTGISNIDKMLPGIGGRVAGQVVGGLASGQGVDLEKLITSAAAPIAGELAVSGVSDLLPDEVNKTVYDIVTGATRGAVTSGVRGGDILEGLVGGGVRGASLSLKDILKPDTTTALTGGYSPADLEENSFPDVEPIEEMTPEEKAIYFPPPASAPAAELPKVDVVEKYLNDYDSYDLQDIVGPASAPTPAPVAPVPDRVLVTEPREEIIEEMTPEEKAIYLPPPAPPAITTAPVAEIPKVDIVEKYLNDYDNYDLQDLVTIPRVKMTGQLETAPIEEMTEEERAIYMPPPAVAPPPITAAPPPITSAPAPAPGPAPTPSPAPATVAPKPAPAPAPKQEDMSWLLALLAQGDEEEAYAPSPFDPGQAFDVNSLFTAAAPRATSQNDQYAQLLQMLRRG